MNVPLIPASWGELWDKITILQIKTHQFRTDASRTNALHELKLLSELAGPPSQVIAHFLVSLLAVNLRLWCIEDRLREHEAAGEFGPTFVALARSVYFENDERGRLKAEVNRLLKSRLVEEKQYSEYGQSL